MKSVKQSKEYKRWYGRDNYSKNHGNGPVPMPEQLKAALEQEKNGQPEKIRRSKSRALVKHKSAPAEEAEVVDQIPTGLFNLALGTPESDRRLGRNLRLFMRMVMAADAMGD